jgi:hypothetical protein
METRRPDRDEITVEVVYLLLAAVSPVLLTIAFEAATWRLFGLTSGAWHAVGRGLLVLSMLLGVVIATFLNHRFRSGRRTMTWRT